MKNKMLATILVTLVTVFTGYNIYQSQNSITLSDLVLANVEALASDNEASGGNRVTCYSSSSSKSGATYYDCGSCTKQFNSKGTGTSSTCKTSE